MQVGGNGVGAQVSQAMQDFSETFYSLLHKYGVSLDDAHVAVLLDSILQQALDMLEQEFVEVLRAVVKADGDAKSADKNRQRLAADLLAKLQSGVNPLTKQTLIFEHYTKFTGKDIQERFLEIAKQILQDLLQGMESEQALLEWVMLKAKENPEVLNAYAQNRPYKLIRELLNE